MTRLILDITIVGAIVVMALVICGLLDNKIQHDSPLFIAPTTQQRT